MCILRSFARKAIAHGEETERAIALLSLIGKGGENHDSFPNVIMGRGRRRARGTFDVIDRECGG